MTGFSVRARPDGDLESVRDLRVNTELVGKGELPFNGSPVTGRGLRMHQGLYTRLPVRVSVVRGSQMSRIVVSRERSAFP